MDAPLPSGSDSDSEDSLVTDREVGVGRARAAGRGARPRSPGTDAHRAPQLQDAFSRGLLKPGLNVVLEGPKKAVNDVVSLGAGSGVLGREMSTRNRCAWVAECFSQDGRNLRVVKSVSSPLGCWGLPFVGWPSTLGLGETYEGFPS